MTDSPSDLPPAAAASTIDPSSGPPARRSGVGSVIVGLLRQPRFIVAAGLLLVCAIGFNAAARGLQLHFRKQRVELRVPALDDKSAGIPKVIAGRWVQVTEDRPLNGDVEKALGTKQYLNRLYIDGKAARKTESELLAMSEERLAALSRELQTAQPEAVIHLHVAYYTGLVDTVAHIPDRCMVADGYRPSEDSYAVVPGPVEYADGKPRGARFRFTAFEDTTAQARVTRNVGYMFRVNGDYTEDPLEVRKRLQNLFETYGYYAKIEMMTEQIGGKEAVDPAVGRAKATKAMTELLADLLPEAERVLPDWAAVTTGSGSTPATPTTKATTRPQP